MLAVFAIAIPALFFLVGLCVMMGMEVRYTRRDENAVDPMFLKKRR